MQTLNFKLLVFLLVVFLEPQLLLPQNCPNDLGNEDGSVNLSAGNANNWSGTSIVTGVSGAAETNGSPCALKLEQTAGSGNTYNRWTIPVQLQMNNNEILEGDTVEFSIDANGLSGNARVMVETEAGTRLVDKTFGQGNGWETYTQSFTVPNDGSALFLIWFFPNVGSTNAGASLFDNLIVRDMNGGTGGASMWSETAAGNDIYYETGNVGIGTQSIGDWQLAVGGKIRAEEIKVETGWADYVFEEDYPLPTLQEVEKHIAEKGHLINIPSADEVEANGIELGEMNKLLLEKIEELTLYIIAADKKATELQKVNEDLIRQQRKTNDRIQDLEKRLKN